MTHNDTSSAQQAGATFTGADGVQRRTIVAGAAWTIPVVATAIGAPLAAASGETPTLAFTNGPYTVAACGTLKDVVITATADGTTPSPAGTLVTVTLPAGLTWSNGDTGARALPADANGEVVLSGVKAIATSGTRTITAASTSASTSAPVAVTASGTAHFAYFTSGALAAGSPATVAGVPVGSTAVGQRTFIAPDGSLYYNDTLVATGVGSAHAEFVGDTSDFITYVSNGVAQYAYFTSGALAAGSPATVAGVPVGSTAVGQRTFIAPDGSLYYNDTLVATGVGSAHAEFVGDNSDFITYVSNGVAQYAYFTSGSLVGTPSAVTGVPVGSTAVGQRTFIAPNGDLYYNDTLVDTNVVSAHAEFVGGTSDFITYAKAGDC